MKKIIPKLIIYDHLSESYRFARLKNERTSQEFNLEEILEIKEKIMIPLHRFTRKKLPSINSKVLKDPREINRQLRNLIESCKDFAIAYRASFYEVVLDSNTPKYEESLSLRGQLLEGQNLTIGRFEGKQYNDQISLIYPNFNLYNPK